MLDNRSMASKLCKNWHSNSLFGLLERSWCQMSPVDNLWTTRQKCARFIHNLAMYLTHPLPSSSASERLKACSSLRSLAVVGILCLFLSSMVLQMQPAQANDADQYKLYAHSRLINEKQYECFKRIIYKESRWNPKAKNGSHYGLGQMRSEHYRTLDPFRQIDASIKYATIRYGSMCNALRFHLKNGHY